MASFLSITIDPAKYADLDADLRLTTIEVEKIVAAALNDAAKQGATQLAKAAAASTTAKQKFFRVRIKTPTAERARPGRLSSLILVKGNRLSLMRFKHRILKRNGVAVEIFRGQRLRIPGAFLGTGPLGSVHVLDRVAGKRRITRAHYGENIGRLRQNVATVLGISVPEIFDERPGLLDAALEQVAAALERRLASQTDRFLAKQAV